MADKPMSFSALLAGKKPDAKPEETGTPELSTPALDSPAHSSPPQPSPAISTPPTSLPENTSPATSSPPKTTPAKSSGTNRSRGEAFETSRTNRSPGEQSAPELSAPVRSSPARQSLGEKPREDLASGYFKMPNVVFDTDGLHGVSPGARLIYYRLLRLTIGHNRPTCTISTAKLAAREEMSDRGVQKALIQLQQLGLIERVQVDQSNRKRSMRGSEWKVFLPDAAPELSAPAPASVMKETLEKEIRKDKFEIRKIALRLRPPGGRLNLDDLRTAMAGQGIEWDDELVAEAIGILMDE